MLTTSWFDCPSLARGGEGFRGDTVAVGFDDLPRRIVRGSAEWRSTLPEAATASIVGTSQHLTDVASGAKAAFQWPHGQAYTSKYLRFGEHDALR